MILTFVLLSSSFAGTAAAFELSHGTYREKVEAKDGTGRVYTVQLAPAKPLYLSTVGKYDVGVMKRDFSDWNFVIGKDPVPGTITVENYHAFKGGALPDESFQLQYQSGWRDPTPGTIFERLKDKDTELRWIQTVISNVKPDYVPASKGNVRVDPIPAKPGEDNLPFYWKGEEGTDGELESAAAGDYDVQVDPVTGKVKVELWFTDRPYTQLNHAPVKANFAVHLAEWNKRKPGDATPPTVTLYDGVSWGYTITCDKRVNTPGPDTQGGVGGSGTDKFEDQGENPLVACVDAVTFDEDPGGPPGVPALSEWGLLALAGVLLGAGIAFGRREEP